MSLIKMTHEQSKLEIPDILLNLITLPLNLMQSRKAHIVFRMKYIPGSGVIKELVNKKIQRSNYCLKTLSVFLKSNDLSIYYLLTSLYKGGLAGDDKVQ